MSLKLPDGCYVAELLLRQAEPDSCAARERQPRLRVEFDDAGGGYFSRLSFVESFAVNDGELAVIEAFLVGVAATNDAAMKSYYDREEKT